MSRISIRSYNTDGPGYVNAEIVWNPADPDVQTVTVSKNLPNSGIASLAVIPSTDVNGYITVPIYPDDVPEVDVFSLPINLAGPLPGQLVDSQLPSIHYSTPYTISSLPDTDLGFKLAAGTQPSVRTRRVLPPRIRAQSVVRRKKKIPRSKAVKKRLGRTLVRALRAGLKRKK